MLGFHVVVKRGLEGQHFFDRQIVKVATGDRKQRHRKLPDLQRLILGLLQDFDRATTALELATGCVVEVGGELRKSGELTILREVGPDTARQLLDDLGLRSTTDARHRNTGVDGRADTGVEEVGLEEDLAVGNRDDVGRHEGRHVACLGLDDRQGSQ